MRITLAGTPGSGKSTVAKAIAKKLGYNYFSGGDMRGKLAIKLGITIDELNKKGETDPSTDKETDDYIKELGEKEDNFVIDARTAWHFVPKSFKIFLKVSPEVAAKRIFENSKEKGAREDEKQYESEEEVLRIITERQKSDKLRYQKWYRIDTTQEKNYDLVLDTTDMTAEQAIEEILNKLPNL